MEHSRVYVAMSGGVDSAGAALLLQKLGYDVTGVTLRLRPGAEGDIDDARRAAQALGVPHEVLDWPPATMPAWGGMRRPGGICCCGAGTGGRTKAMYSTS